MKTFILFTLLYSAPFLAYCQDIWAATSTSDATSESMDIVMDDAGNSYITGYISGDTEFQDIQIDINMGYSDVIVAKINPEGVYEWVKRFNGPLSDKGAKIVLASNNDLILTGTFYNSITFGSTTLTASGGSKDIFLARLSNSGDVIWARREGGGMGENVYGLALDQNDNIILTGQFEGTSTIGSQTFTSMIDPETNLPSFDIFLAKYDNNGNPLWAKASYAEYEDRGLAVACDNQDNIYLTGQFSDTINYFGQAINNQIYNAGFVGKFDANGNRLWFDKLAAAQVLAYDMVINHQNQLIVTGDYLGQLVVWAQENQQILSNPYSKKVFVLKFGLNGNYIWGRAKGSESEVSSRTVCVDEQDNIYIGGHFKCNFDEFRDSTGTAHWQSVGFRDQFVVKFTTSGSTVWKNHVGGQREDQCWGIAIRENDYPVITGSYATNLIFPFDLMSPGNLSNIPKQSYNNYDFGDEINYTYVTGDESINIHVSKMVSDGLHYYNYYGMLGSDSIPMKLSTAEDSVDFCLGGQVCLETQTLEILGPLYEGGWSNGVSLDYCVDNSSTDGFYSVLVNRMDACYNYSDGVYIDYHPIPALPFLTDDAGVNNSTNIYEDIWECEPDTLAFYLQGLCPGCSASIYTEFLDDYATTENNLVMDSTYYLTESSVVVIGVVSSYGCNRSNSFFYNLIPQVVPNNDTIVPYLILHDTYDHNDSIMICRNGNVRVIVSDSLTNPNGNFIPHGKPVHSSVLSVTNNGQNVGTIKLGDRFEFSPVSSGWHYIIFDHVLGVEVYNQCQNLVDTTHYPLVDSFYVEIKDQPLVQIMGAELLCPDTYNYLSVSMVIPGVVWDGPGILWTSLDNDSIMLNESGYYTVDGIYDYGEISCPFSDYVLISEKHPPLILLDPVDGIVCPGDSVLLSLDRIGISYEWIGPEGFAISYDSAIYVTDQGFYACIFTDTSGCQLLTGQAEVREYTTPFIELSPVDFMCEFEPITLTAIYGGMVNLLWHAPINSTSSSVVVNEPGVYSCEITQCGITVHDSVTIIDASYEIDISSEATVFCIGDTVILSTSPGLAGYQWSNGFMGLNFLEATEPGTYSVQTWNEYGCTASSDSITITAFPESFPPPINDTFVCQGGNIDLVYNSAFDFGWYHDPGDATPFSTQDTISFTGLMADTILYIAHNSANCPLNFTEVLVEALLPLTPPEIIGDTTVCEGETAVFEVEPVTNGSYFWVYDGDTISNQNTVTVPNITEDSPLTFYIAMADGCTETENEISIVVKFPSPISISATSDTLCYGETLFATASGSGNVLFTWSDGVSTWNGTNLAANYFELNSETISVYGVDADNCRSEILSLSLTKSPDANLHLTLDTLTCLGNNLTISAVDSLGQITWYLPDGSSEAGYTLTLESLVKADEGLYVAGLVNYLNCLISDTLMIDVLDLPFFTLGGDSILCADNAYDLFVPEIEGYTFYWGSGSQEPVFTPNGDPVTLTAIDSNFCRFTDTSYITLVDCSGWASNVITSNGDGINEYFTVFNAEYEYDNCLIILNRWGNVVYEQPYYRNTFKGYTTEGEKLNDGVYYFLYYSDCSRKREITHQGYFHIISE